MQLSRRNFLVTATAGAWSVLLRPYLPVAVANPGPALSASGEAVYRACAAAAALSYESGLAPDPNAVTTTFAGSFSTFGEDMAASIEWSLARIESGPAGGPFTSLAPAEGLAFLRGWLYMDDPAASDETIMNAGAAWNTMDALRYGVGINLVEPDLLRTVVVPV